MNAIPVTANASGHVSRKSGDLSRPCTSPSSAPPASISTSAQEPCAYMWIDEFVKNAITGQSRTPIPNAIPGQRYLRHGRICQTSCPTIASLSRHSPTSRIPAAKAQWTISAWGSMVRLQVRQQRPRDDEPKDHADRSEEEWRFQHEPPEALLPRVEEGQPPRLEDPPDHAGGDRRGADQRDNARASGARNGRRRYVSND